MKPQDHNPDPLDELLAKQPVQPSDDFADRTLARLREEDAAQSHESALEEDLDALLGAQPVKPAADFADRVIAQLEPQGDASEPEQDKVVGFPSWVIAMGSIAALMVLGMFSFITLFDYAADQKGAGAPQIADNTPAANDAAQPSVDHVAAPVTEDSALNEDVLVAESMTPAPLVPSAEVVEYETVISLDETLDDALLLADVETLNTLQAFLN